MGDGAELYNSGVLTGASAAVPINVDLKGAKYIDLVVDPNGSNGNDWADWADAKFICSDDAPALALTPVVNPGGPLERGTDFSVTVGELKAGTEATFSLGTAELGKATASAEALPPTPRRLRPTPPLARQPSRLPAPTRTARRPLAPLPSALSGLPRPLPPLTPLPATWSLWAHPRTNGVPWSATRTTGKTPRAMAHPSPSTPRSTRRGSVSMPIRASASTWAGSAPPSAPSLALTMRSCPRHTAATWCSQWWATARPLPPRLS